MVDNNIDDIMIDILMKEIFNRSTLSYPIIGSKKNIKNITRNDLIKFREKFYSPCNTIFITVGNIEYKKIGDLLYNKIKKQCNYKINRKEIIPKQNFPKLNISLTESTKQINILFGFHHNGYKQNEEYNLCSKIISTSLTEGSSSQLLESLRTKYSLAYNCSSYNIELEDTSIFMINSSVDEKRCDTAIEIILNVLIKLIKDGLKMEEIKRCKKTLINNNKLNEKQSDILQYYLDNSIQKTKLLTPENELKLLNKITKKEIKNGCKHIFRSNNLNLILMGKISNKCKNKIIKSLDSWYYTVKKFI